MARAHGLLKRLAVATAFVLAFMIMASVFTPKRSPAAWPGWDPDLTPRKRQSDDAATGVTSSDPHEGLRTLGSIESAHYRIDIYATDGGARYSLYDAATGAELGALMSLEQVERYYPEIGLPALELDGAPLLLADTPQSR